MGTNFSSRAKTESGFTTILIGIFLITLLFITYNIFLNTRPNVGIAETPLEETSIVDKIKSIFSSKNADQIGVIDGGAAMDSRDETVAGAESDRNLWVATDYTQGDIQAGQYVVKKGDTLWEIAEAVYGDGSQWHKILDANKGNIGFLPNGSQALIITGQLLNLP